MDTSENEDQVEVVVQELRVEHVLAALDRIQAMCAEVRSAIEGLDHKMLLKRIEVGQTLGNPPPLGRGCDSEPIGDGRL